jgi:single-strand DNA-binding protein
VNVNKCICIGNLTRDPELRSLPSGNSVCDLRIAVDGMARGGDAGYINVSVFGKPGEAAAQHLTRGWLVAVDGRLEFVEWETDAGEKRHDYSIVGNVEFLASPRHAGEDEDGEEQEEVSTGSRRRRPVAA